MKGQQEAKERTSGVVSSASREGLAEPDCSGGCCSRVTFISVVQAWQSCMARHGTRQGTVATESTHHVTGHVARRCAIGQYNG
jgi:hypothetical protein